MRLRTRFSRSEGSSGRSTIPQGKRKRVVRVAQLVGISLGVLWFVPRPSNDRDWVDNQATLAYASFTGDQVRIHNIRNTTYRAPDDYTPAYYDKSFDLNRLVRAWYIVEPFSEWEGAAHTFLSFEFEGPEYISISVEIRKEKGEGFSAVKGLFKQYEILYVVADERDAIKLRTNYRKDDVFLYPVRAPDESVRGLFISMLERANELRDRPEFYNTLTSTCTTNIVRHVNDLVPGRVPFSYQVLFPGYSDRYAYDLGLLDTELPFESARAHFKVNDGALAFAEDEDFSVRIREQPSR